MDVDTTQPPPPADVVDDALLRIAALRQSVLLDSINNPARWNATFPAPTPNFHPQLRTYSAERYDWREHRLPMLTWDSIRAAVPHAEFVAAHIQYPPDVVDQMRQRYGANSSPAQWLTPDQRAFVVVAMLGYSVFVTGSAGTGKSAALRVAIHSINAVSDRIMLVCSTTGVSACNIGGMTIDSALALHVMESNRWLNLLKKRDFSRLETLVLDEVSMLQPPRLYEISHRLMALRAQTIEQTVGYEKAEHNANGHLPFGAVQLILIGDFFQLPPVFKDQRDKRSKISKVAEANYFFDNNGLRPERKLIEAARHVFEVPLFASAIQFCVHFKQVMRQEDAAFVSFLEQLRYNRLHMADVATIMTRCGRASPPDNAMCLFPRNQPVQEMNRKRMDALNTDPVVAAMIQRQRPGVGADQGYMGPIERKEEQVCTYKVNSVARLTRNYPLSNGSGFVNGARGSIVCFMPITEVVLRHWISVEGGGHEMVDEKLGAPPRMPDSVRQMMRNSGVDTVFRSNFGHIPSSYKVTGLSGNGFVAQLNKDAASVTLVFTCYSTNDKNSDNTFGTTHPLFTDRRESRLSYRQKDEDADASRAVNFVYDEPECSALRYFVPLMRFQHLANDNHLVLVPPALYTSHIYENRRARPVVSQVQWPLIIAYASTIHRSQGMTLDQVAVKAEWYQEGSGLLYTAITRARSLDGLSLVDVSFYKNRPNPNVVCFYRCCLE